MSDLMSAFSTLFTFLFEQLGSFANFFVSNTLGVVILGMVVFSIMIYLIMYILRNLR